LVVLDDCDPEYKDKESYADNLTLFDRQGKLAFRSSGLNNCQEIGSPHRIAFDAARERLWVSEVVGQRLLQYDLNGKEVLVVPDVPASAIALDPATGRLWVLRSAGQIGKGSTDVYDHLGKLVADYGHIGYD